MELVTDCTPPLALSPARQVRLPSPPRQTECHCPMLSLTHLYAARMPTVELVTDSRPAASVEPGRCAARRREMVAIWLSKSAPLKMVDILS